MISVLAKNTYHAIHFSRTNNSGEYRCPSGGCQGRKPLIGFPSYSCCNTLDVGTAAE